MPEATLEEAGERAALRVKSFAGFFKNYMGVSSLVVAALPVPIGELGLIPVPQNARHFFSVYTSLFCFLTFAFIFYSRHGIGRHFFFSARDNFVPIFLAIAPALLILSSMMFVFAYHGVIPSDTPEGFVLPQDGLIQALFFYLGIFMSAEAAFVLMATKEYLLDVMKISDIQLIAPKSAAR